MTQPSTQAHQKHVREPLVHIARRDSMPWWKSWLIRIAAVLIALLVCAGVTILLTGENPLSIYGTMIKGALGTQRRIWDLFQNVAMLLCVSLALTPAFKMRFWNIGGEGQVLIGGLATAACMILLGDSGLPTAVLLFIMVVASVGASAVWALIPALFKAKWNTNETLFTLMMNYIAIQLVSFFIYKWEVPKGSGTIGIINQSSQVGWLPKLGSSYLLNILIVLALTVLMYIYLKYSKHGYEIAVVGESENTARYIGINVKKVIVRTMALSGAICGIAGFLLVSGTDHTISTATANGRGFTAIMVSWLAKFNPLFMILTSLLLVFLQKGANEISSVFRLNVAFADIITGIILFFIIGSEFFINYTLRFRSSHKEGQA